MKLYISKQQGILNFLFFSLFVFLGRVPYEFKNFPNLHVLGLHHLGDLEGLFFIFSFHHWINLDKKIGPMDQEVIDAIEDIQLDDTFLGSKFDFKLQFYKCFFSIGLIQMRGIINFHDKTYKNSSYTNHHHSNSS